MRNTSSRPSFPYHTYLISLIAMLTMAPAFAQGQTCSSEDDTLLQYYQMASLNALIGGDINTYFDLQQELPTTLSSSCQVYLNKLEPMRVTCTQDEKNEIMQSYQTAMKAAKKGNFNKGFRTFKRLEKKLSSACWIATNRHTAPQVVNACSNQELDHMASYSGPMLDASQELLRNWNMEPLMKLRKEAFGGLSEPCATTMNNYELQLIASSFGDSDANSSYVPPSIIELGDGIYTVPGSGACTPSGCVVY